MLGKILQCLTALMNNILKCSLRRLEGQQNNPKICIKLLNVMFWAMYYFLVQKKNPNGLDLKHFLNIFHLSVQKLFV